MEVKSRMSLFSQSRSRRAYILGAFISQFMNSLWPLTFVNTIMTATILWQTGFDDFIVHLVPWCNYWLFLSSGFLAALAWMVVDYKYIHPGRMAYWQNQIDKWGKGEVDKGR